MDTNAGEGQKSETARREEEVLKFWQDNDIFNKSVKKDAPKGDYVFYDGPPFATGTPHYGHLVGSAMKDVVPRYWTMKGFRVTRQWGWDCHGLPIENIVEKNLGTKSKKDIEALGVKKFNDLCREQIFTYVDLWNQFIPRFGRWADMEKPYRTMDKDFMESEWWAFKTLYEQGLIYEDYRTMHICPRCETTLSQSEVVEGYKEVRDLSLTVKFKVKNPEKIGLSGDVYLLAWTTTPWTLPGNVALAVGEDITYFAYHLDKLEGGKDNTIQHYTDKSAMYIASADFLRKGGLGDAPSPETAKSFKGTALLGLEYQPLFDYYEKDSTLKNRKNGWKVYADKFVTTDTGTGIVHIAPAFGADDLKLGQRENLPFVQHVGMDGVIKPEVTDFTNESVSPRMNNEATQIRKIDLDIYQFLGIKVFDKKNYPHEYPHCWRCDTALLNYATSSWFVGVEKLKPDLLEYAKAINWAPAHIKDGRFGKWLEGARDWSISRQRFWANTIPVWRCEKCKAEKVFGSAAELEQASGTMVADLHKDVVDEITAPCECGGVMRRVPDVLDTWFNSGSVPFAALHYPMEHEAEFNARMPADFIAEGIDQCRTWFYYQHILAGGLFKKHAFKNVIANGIVLAEDGKKMAKRLKNYPDPVELLNKYGADAVRLYMLASPVVRAENLNFSESGVGEVASKVIARLVNSYSLYALYRGNAEHTPNNTSENVLDRWIIARTHQLTAEVTDAMNAYDLQSATRPLIEFIDDLSTWYIRRSRERFKGDQEHDKIAALATTSWVLREYARLIAPFAPFIADWLWRELKQAGDAESVHLASWPEKVTLADDDGVLVNEMESTRRAVSLALQIRAQAKIKVRQPLACSRISEFLIKSSSIFREDLYKQYKEEVNVKKVIPGSPEDMEVEVELDTLLTEDLVREGKVRDIIRAVQDLRKKKGLQPGDAVLLRVATNEHLKVIIDDSKSELAKTASLSDIQYVDVLEGAEELNFTDGKVLLALV